MIDSIENLQSTRVVNKPVSIAKKQKTTAETEKAVGVDRFENSKKDKKMSGKLEYTEPTKFLRFITLREGFYTYYPLRNETIADIKRKFKIKDGIIKEMNGIDKDSYCPAQNHIYKIYFRLDN